ncbi:MAG: ATP-binding protein [Archangium sp.]|nr:ATP-binding protein [Archangium sp.]
MGTTTHATDRLTEWRIGVARLYLTGVALGIPVLVVVWLALRPPPRFDLAFAFVSGTWVAFTLVRLFAPRKAIAPLVVSLLMGTGIGGPLVLGLSPGPFLSLMSGVIIGGAVFGRKVGLALLAVGAGSILVTGLLASTGTVSTISLQPTDPFVVANWLRMTVFFLLTSGMLLFVLTGLLARMEDAWRATADAAERERLEQVQRRLAEERAIAAQRLEAVGRLAGGVAHDFNNLLVVIMTWVDLLPTAKDDAERKEGLDAIREASKQASHLTRQLLSFARKTVTQPRAIDVDGFCATQVKSVRRLMADDVKVELVPAGPPPALVDETQLGQVLLNLTLNARDAMPRGGTLTIRTALLEAPNLPPEAPDPNGRYVAISVTDTGVGMKAETLARIYEPFFSTKATGHGTGLGLASVYGIVSQARGWTRAESELGKGSTFTVAFPVAPVDMVVTAVQEPSELPNVEVRHRILLVEDDASVRSTMAAALRRAGIEPIEAANADEALVLAKKCEGQLELLCTDGVMPGAPTHVLITGFRALFPKTPVLLCSGYIDEELINRGIAEGTVEVLPKPFAAEALVAKVRELIKSPSR